MRARFAIMDIVRDVAAEAGFHPVGTPALEYLSVLLGQGGEETDKQVYRFKDHGGRDVGLRFDLTVPFARFVAEHQAELAFPFKRVQIGDVWRGENTQKGRYREFCQCDLDIIGVNSMSSDIEILLCIHRILTKVNFGSFTIKVGNRPLLSSLIRATMPNLSHEKETSALIALDKLEKIGEKEVLNLLVTLVSSSTQDAQIPHETCLKGPQRLLDLLKAKTSSNESDLDAVINAFSHDQEALAEAERLKTTLLVLKNLTKDSPGKFALDISIARGLGYYNGIVYETTIDELPGFGSISSGGRYNDLASRFMSRQLPGVGGSVGLDRLIAGLEELEESKGPGGSQLIPKTVSNMVFVAVATHDSIPYAFTIAQKLRAAGIKVDIGLTEGKLGHHFKHADRLGCRLVITVGTSEKESSSYSLKHMKTGTEEKSLPLSSIIEKVKDSLD